MSSSGLETLNASVCRYQASANCCHAILDAFPLLRRLFIAEELAYTLPVLRITHTTPNRLLSHLRKLQRDGEALLALSRWLEYRDEACWDVRVWKCLDKIADRTAFQSATERDHDDVGDIDLLDFNRPLRSEQESDELLRRRINRRLITLASVIEKVEAYAQEQSEGGRQSGPVDGCPF